MIEKEEITPPDALYVRQRWLPIHTVEWVRNADAIMLEHGIVSGTREYEKRHQARWRAQHLIDLMIVLGLHKRWQLIEHTGRHPNGWVWSVEYLKEKPDGR